MKNWVHPYVWRGRIISTIQVIIGTGILIVAPFLYFMEPTRDHGLIALFLVVISPVVIFLGIREFKRLPYIYRYEEPEEEERTPTSEQ